MMKEAITVLPRDRKLRRQYSREASLERTQTLIRRRDHGFNKSFKRAPPSLWLGYTYQLHPVSRQLRLTIRLTGLLPESLQNKKSANINLAVRLHTGDAVKKTDVCIVRRGQQLKASNIIFDNISLETLKNSEIKFSVYFRKGHIFKTNESVMKWEVSIDTEKVLRSNCDWKNINTLS